MEKSIQLSEVYQIGQLVYTKSNIRGWFDKSIKTFIPTNTPCTIVNYYQNESYLVRFDNKFVEFGEHIVHHIDLKLG